MEHIGKTAPEVRQRLEAEMDRASGRSLTPQSSDKCAFCGGTGYARCPAGVVRCECQRRKILEQKIGEIPARFRNSTLASYVPVDGDQEKAVTAIHAKLTGSFFLWGNYARGKTHLATAQYIELVKLERPCLFLTMAELVFELRRSELDSDYFCVVRQRVRHAEPFHLFIDDIDKFKATEFKTEALFDLFDTIYKRELGLTVTSNFSLEELQQAQSLHPAIIRRIDDICRVIEV
jgi:DNA replication protein DnaC